jgi:hypothetical protein
MTLLTEAQVSESARAFLAAVSVAPEVLELRPDYRVLVMAAEGLEPGLPDQISEELLSRAEIRARVTLDGRAPEDVPQVADWRTAYRAFGARPSAPVRALRRCCAAWTPGCLASTASPTPTTRSRSRTWWQSAARTWTSTRARPGWSGPPATRTSTPQRTASRPPSTPSQAR